MHYTPSQIHICIFLRNTSVNARGFSLQKEAQEENGSLPGERENDTGSF